MKTYGEHEYELNFHFNAETHPKIENAENGENCVHKFSADGVGLRLFTFGDNGNWQSKENYISPCYGIAPESKLMRFISIGRGMQEFFTFLLPDGNRIFKARSV